MTFSVKNISKKFYDHYVLQDISFEAKSNDFISITGPSGSGKTTLLSIIATLSQPSNGAIYYNDINLSNLSNEDLSLFRNEHFGFVFQSANMIPYLNVKENILLPLSYAKNPHYKSKERMVTQLLQELQLQGYEEKKINELSGGEQQRVAIARALIQNPNIIFADEPTGNLDAQNTTIILDKLQNIAQEENKMVIIVTHDPMVSSYCSKQIKLSKL